jgi:hypothetical protein
MVMTGLAVTINAPGQNIGLEDCQPSNVTVTGVPTCWLYRQSKDSGGSFILTTAASAATSWGLALKSGSQVYLEGKIVGRQRNGTNTGFFHIAVSAGRPGASLPYGTETGAFTIGNIVTGATSNATGRIVADSGTALTLYDVTGVFVANEIITDGAGGSATTTAGITESNAALVGSVTSLRAAQKTDAAWAATFVAVGAEIVVQVTGDTAMTIEWTTSVQVTQDQGTPIVVATAGYSSLTFNGLSGAFTAGQYITDATQSRISPTPATAVIVSAFYAGTAGTLVIANVNGIFAPGDTITVPGGTFATVVAFHA